MRNSKNVKIEGEPQKKEGSFQEPHKLHERRDIDDGFWCPICFDGLDTYEIIVDNKIQRFEYECFGCNKRFILIEKGE